MSKQGLVDTAWVAAACALITWQDGVLRFIGLLWLAASLVAICNLRGRT